MSIVCMVPPSLGHAKASARAELIASALSRELGKPVEAQVAESYTELEKRTNAAEVDIVWCPSAVCAKLTSARAVFTVVRAGVSNYRSAIIARREDHMNLLNLVGKRAAWVDPLSAGGHLLALALLKTRGIDADPTFASQVFLGTHRAVALAVLQKDVDVAAVSVHSVREDDLGAMMRWYVGPAGDRLEALAVSERCPNDALVVTSKLDEELAQRAISALTKANDGAKGSQLLAALEAERTERTELRVYQRAFGYIAHQTSFPPPPMK